MPGCECLKDCPYFENSAMEGIDLTAEVRRQEYCMGDYHSCARYMVFKALGKENVPDDLLPFQVERVQKLITMKKQSVENP